jgi:hypothetical protein
MSNESHTIQKYTGEWMWMYSWVILESIWIKISDQSSPDISVILKFRVLSFVPENLNLNPNLDSERGFGPFGGDNCGCDGCIATASTWIWWWSLFKTAIAAQTKQTGRTILDLILILNSFNANVSSSQNRNYLLALICTKISAIVHPRSSTGGTQLRRNSRLVACCSNSRLLVACCSSFWDVLRWSWHWWGKLSGVFFWRKYSQRFDGIWSWLVYSKILM